MKPAAEAANVNRTGSPSYRIGIDVGGTFTKAVLIDDRTRHIVARSSVHTTHDHERGVAAGITEVFQRVLTDSGVDPRHIGFLAHSTTQATNALLEGDIAHVGVVGVAPGKIAGLAQKQVTIGPVELAAGKILNTGNRFLVAEDVTEAAVEAAVQSLMAEGAQVIVASAAFGVDDASTEEMIRTAARKFGLLVTCGHEMTRLYGLPVRTRTAVINASILPTMIATADMTESSVRAAGIASPLMIMRGDGGVMNIHEVRRRPALTMLSGPAASVAGALMHVGMSDGIYFEVGGTSTNIGVVKDGRPAVAYARVGGHETFINSLDIRILGVAGGSLVRVGAGEIVDVGPRSAHIAGLPYASHADPAALTDARLIMFEPREGDGAGFVALETPSGQRLAITTTCAANALGLVGRNMHAFADPRAACIALSLLADFLDVDVATAATAVLDHAIAKILPVLESLATEHRLDRDQQTLIAVGGGVGSFIQHIANRTGCRFIVPQDAEIISSIGVALAMVRETVERIVPNPMPADVLAVRKEAEEAAIRSGADIASIDVAIEIDKATGRVRAVATGSTQSRTSQAAAFLDEVSARKIAAQAFVLPFDDVLLRAQIPAIRVYSTEPSGFAPIRVVDHHGHVRFQRSAAQVDVTTAGRIIGRMTELCRNGSAEDVEDTPFCGGIVFFSQKMIDLCSIDSLDQALALVGDALPDMNAETAAMFIWFPQQTRPAAVPLDP